MHDRSCSDEMWKHERWWYCVGQHYLLVVIAGRGDDDVNVVLLCSITELDNAVSDTDRFCLDSHVTTQDLLVQIITEGGLLPEVRSLWCEAKWTFG